MKKLLLLIGMIMSLIFPLACVAQTTIEYHYDSSGNRTERVIVLNTKSANIGGDENSSEVVDDKLDAGEIKIYPNPTEGLLKIDLPNLDLPNANLYLYDLNAKLIQQQTAVRGGNEMNLSAYSAGVYLLIIQAGQEKWEWKIIKK